MSYTIYLKKLDPITVDDKVGSKVMSAKETGQDDATFQANGSLYQISEVRSVVKDNKSASMTSAQREIEDKILIWEKQQAVYAREDAKKKTQREFKYRVKSVVRDIENHVNYEAAVKDVYKFFVDNTTYPWCPYKVWAVYLFDNKTPVPGVMKLVAVHDMAVYRWMSEADSKVLGDSKDKLLEVFDGGLGLIEEGGVTRE